MVKEKLYSNLKLLSLYFQSTKGGGHGDYRLITLAPASVQEMYDFVGLAFELAFKYRNPALILSDGMIGQVMEKVVIDDYKPRWTNEYIEEHCPWAATGHRSGNKHTIVTSLELEALKQEAINERIQAKYRKCEEEDARHEAIQCDDAEYLFVAYGSAARICMKAMELARAEGIKDPHAWLCRRYCTAAGSWSAPATAAVF